MVILPEVVCKERASRRVKAPWMEEVVLRLMERASIVKPERGPWEEKVRGEKGAEMWTGV